MLLSSLAISYRITPQFRQADSSWRSDDARSLEATHYIDWQDETIQGLFEDAFRISQVQARSFLEQVLPELPEEEQQIVLHKLNRGEPTLELRINLDCDNACTHCFIEHREKSYTPPFHELQKLVDASEPNTHVTLTGGEPTLHPQFVPLVRYIRKTGRLVSIQSNGRAFKDRSLVDAIALYTHAVQVPIHSIRESVFDHITQKQGSFRETIRGLANLHGKVRVQTQTVITRLNYQELGAIADFLHEVLDGNVLMVFTYPCYEGAAIDNIQEVAVTYEELQPYLHQALSKYAAKIHTHYIPACYLHPYLQDVTCVDLGASLHSHVGFDLRESQLQYGDTNQNLSQKYLKAPECSQCQLDKMCPGTLREYESLAKYQFRPTPLMEASL